MRLGVLRPWQCTTSGQGSTASSHENCEMQPNPALHPTAASAIITRPRVNAKRWADEVVGGRRLILNVRVVGRLARDREHVPQPSCGTEGAAAPRQSEAPAKRRPPARSIPPCTPRMWRA